MALAPLLTRAEVVGRLDAHAGWQHVGDKLCKTFRWRDFAEAVEFVARITPKADELYHHPDVEIHWNRVRVLLWSHEEGGLTAKDFELAALVDEAAGELS